MWSRWAMDLVNTRNRGFPMANLTVEIWPTLRIPTMILQPLISKHECIKYVISVTLPSKKVIMALRFVPVKHGWLVMMNPCYSIMTSFNGLLMARDFEICQADLPFPLAFHLHPLSTQEIGPQRLPDTYASLAGHDHYSHPISNTLQIYSIISK